MKKVYSFIVSSALVAANLTALTSFSANDERTNIIGTSAQVIENDLVLDSGDIIPSGTVALTVSINNNDGFITSALKLNVEDADILLDVNDKPIITKGDVLSDSLISAAAEDNQIVVSSAAAAVDATSDDGDMFTIYLSDEPSDVVVYDISDLNFSADNDNTVNRTQGRIGNVDIDPNNDINAIDASYVLSLYGVFGKVEVDQFNTHPIYQSYFPTGSNGILADTNVDGDIKDDDAQRILDFYSYVALGHTKDQAFAALIATGNYCYSPCAYY